MKVYIVYSEHLMPCESGHDILGVFSSEESARQRMEEEMNSVLERWDDGNQSFNVDIDPNVIRIEHVNDELPWIEIVVEEQELQN